MRVRINVDSLTSYSNPLHWFYENTLTVISHLDL